LTPGTQRTHHVIERDSILQSGQQTCSRVPERVAWCSEHGLQRIHDGCPDACRNRRSLRCTGILSPVQIAM